MATNSLNTKGGHVMFSQESNKNHSADIKLDLNLSEDKVEALMLERSNPKNKINAELVASEEVRVPEAYNRFKDLEEKEAFREKLVRELSTSFEKIYGVEKAKEFKKEFLKLAKSLEDNGAVIFGNMIDTEAFQKLIDSYTPKLKNDGSKSWIHSFINLGNHPDFIQNQEFNSAFVHPLMLALISYGAGGAIRMVDARGKDAEPLAVQAQDNMLHIDNTPFRREYKIIVTWERGKPSGPKGQNFVFIPGTHKGVRNCFKAEDGSAWSTEDGSIFTSTDAVDKIFTAQEKLYGKSPIVVEATHPDMPLTTVFEAGALIHHRYRTKEKNIPRSCTIFAFHRAKDNPGKLLDQSYLQQSEIKNGLLNLVLGAEGNTDDNFISAVVANTEVIANKIEALSRPDANSANQNPTRVVPFNERLLSEKELEVWKKTVTAAPTVSEIKQKEAYFHLGDTQSHELTTTMMMYDKHGPLDVILYGDGREEIRKWARNRIREMPQIRLENRLEIFERSKLTQQPSPSQLMTPQALHQTSLELIAYMDSNKDKLSKNGFLDKGEKITSEIAFRSIRQVIADLGEAVLRCASPQTFLSTSLFILWACDELTRFSVGNDKLIAEEPFKAWTQKLLSNYFSTYVLVEKQIEFKKQLSADSTLTQQAHGFTVWKQDSAAGYKNDKEIEKDGNNIKVHKKIGG